MGEKTRRSNQLIDVKKVLITNSQKISYIKVSWVVDGTAQKIMLSIKDFFSKCDEISRTTDTLHRLAMTCTSPGVGEGDKKFLCW